VKRHAVAQRERPGEAVPRDGPAGREPGIDVGRSLTVGDERVEDLARDERDRPLERRRGIERRGNARRPDPHLAPRAG